MTGGELPTVDVAQLGTPFADLVDDSPLLLMPVRVETRYRLDRDPAQLLVRIYPDQIHIRHGIAPPTDAERVAVHEFWNDVHAGGEAARAAAWQRLSARTGHRRAAQLAHRHRPTRLVDGGLEFPPPQAPPAGDAETHAALLPGQWVVTGYDDDGTRLFRVGSRPVSRALRTGPSASAPTWDVGGTGVVVDEALAWMVDFDRAVSEGMAVAITLTGAAAGAATGVATLVVVGVDATLSPDEGAAQLTDLLAAHRDTDGLAFVPQGTPTNSTDGAVTTWSSTPAVAVPGLRLVPPELPGPVGGPGIPGGVPPLPVVDNATRLARLLGLGSGTPWRSLSGGAVDEFGDAQAMRIALFETTMGVWARRLLELDGQPGIEAAAVDELRRWFVDHVVGGAPVPTIRVADQPYGILPVRPPVDDPDESTTPGRVEHLVRLLQPWWEAAAGRVPSIDHGATDSSTDAPVETALATILATQPHPARWLSRRLEDFDDLDGVERLLTPQSFYEVALQALSSATNPAFGPPISYVADLYASLNGDGQNYEIEDQVALWSQMHREFPDWLADRGLTDEDGAGLGFISGVRGVVEAYESRQYPLPLLDMARRGVALGRRVVGPDGPAVETPPNNELIQAMMYGSVVEWGAAGLVEGAGVSAAEYLADLRDAFAQRDAARTPRSRLAAEFLAAPPLLYQLLSATAATVPADAAIEGEYTGALERLAALHPDQLAWQLGETLGLGTHRLDAWNTSLAAHRLDHLRDTGDGGVQIGGYAVLTDLVPAAGGSPSQGYVHAPSMAQAATAAMLRAGFLAHGDAESSSAYAIDLSSRRVRDARWLLDGISSRQPLGELLGCRFERELHDAGQDLLIRPVRQAVLAAQGRSRASLDRPVDGVELLDLTRSGAVVLEPGAAAALAAVEASFDAANDLAIAEGVHQVAAGNYARASAILDTVATGTARPPRPEVVETRRSGSSIEHRLVVLLAADAPADGRWPSGPRDRVTPHVARWAAGLLPDPQDVGFTVVDGEKRTGRRLVELGLGVLDAVFLVSDDPGQAGEALATLIRCISGVPVAATIDLTDRGSAPYSLAEFAVACVELRRILDSSRPADARDLRRAHDAGEPDTDAAAITTAVDLAVGAFGAATDTLAAALITGDRTALVAAAAGLARYGLGCSGDPGDVAVARALLDRSTATQQRIIETTTDAERVTVLFSHAVPLTPSFTLDAVVADAVAVPDQALADADTVERWLDEMGRVRPAVGRLTHVGLLADTFGCTGWRAVAGQTPRLDGEGWAAVERPADPGTRLSCTYLVADTIPGRGSRACGLVVDRWVEAIPDPLQTTGVAVHFDAPSNQAPQTCLLAVLPAKASWDIDVVHDLVLDTMAWARRRAVVAEDLVVPGRSIPSTFVPGSIVAWPDEAVAAEGGG